MLETATLTSLPEAFAVPTIDARTIANLLVEKILARHGAPRTLLSDRETNFLSTLVRSVCDQINTKKVNTTAYNHTLCQFISMFISSDQKDWNNHLAAILFAYRVSPHDTTGESPFCLLYGREPRLPVHVSLLPPRNESSSITKHCARIVQTLEEAHAIARENIQRAQQKMKEIYDRSARDPKFMIGDKVWIYTPKTKKGLSRKLMHHWHGPYRIVEKCSPVHYKLRTCDNRLVSVTVHASQIKPYFSSDLRPSNTLEGTSANSGPAIPDEDLPADSFSDYHPIKHTRDSQHEPAASDTQDSTDTLYNIEQILKHRNRRGKKQILVKWEGYGSEHNSWIDETDVVQTNTN